VIDVTHIIPLDIHTDNVTDVACQGAHFDPVSGIWYTEPHVLNEGFVTMSTTPTVLTSLRRTIW
jgi:hypothetical protein